MAKTEKTDETMDSKACEMAVTYSSGLESINVLADRHRLPSWQLAALLRMMDWQDGIMVSDEDFRAAINKLRSRRIGGGRM